MQASFGGTDPFHVWHCHLDLSLEVLLKSLADLLVKGSAAVSNEASEAAGPSVAPASEAPAAPAAPQEPAKARGLSTASRREQWMLDDNAAGNMSSNICQTYLLAACQ